MLRSISVATTVAISLLLAAGGARADAVIPIGVTGVADIAVNPITREIWVVIPGEDRVLVVNGTDHSFESVAVGDAPRGAHVDPVRNRIWIDHAAPVVSVIDGPTREVTTIPLPAGWTSLAVDPYLGRVYVPLGAELGVIDAETLALTIVAAPAEGAVVDARNDGVIVFDRYVVQRLAGNPPAVVDSVDQPFGIFDDVVGLAIDAGTGRAILGDFDGSPRVVDWRSETHLYPPDFFGFASYSPVPEPTARRMWVPSHDPFTCSFSFLFVFDPESLAQQPPSLFFLCFDRVAVNPATRRAYTAPNDPIGLLPAGISVIDGTDLSVTFRSVDGLLAAWLPVVDAGSNRVYAVGLRQRRSYDLVEIDEPVAIPVPLDVAITADPILAGLPPVVRFTATSGFVPYPLPIRQIYWQVDSTSGAWSYADEPGAEASATLANLAPGPHIVHAFATDGQEVTASLGANRTSSGTPIVGPIASLEITVPPPPPCSNGIDDDGDGAVDHPADRGCASALAHREDPACDNQIDDDGDELVDHPSDPSCFAAWDGNESAGGYACGIGAELALLLIALRRRIARRT